MISLLNLKIVVDKYKKVLFVAAFTTLSLAIVSGVILTKGHQDKPQESILGTAISTSPSPTTEPTPSPSPTPKVTINPAPTPTPSPSQSPSSSPTSSSSSSSSSSSQSSPAPTPSPNPTTNPSPAPTPTPSPSPSPSPTPQPNTIQITVNYAGYVAKPNDTYNDVAITTGEKAWDATVAAIGAGNLQYKDYGGSLGIFITGINGTAPSGNHYWEFDVNGKSSDVGVSSYVCQNGDKLEFKIASF